jgi:3-oxoacyl-[acyl-carrier protein] reductase
MKESTLCDFSGKTVLITGSTQNLGYTIAREFSRYHARVVIHGPTKKEALHARGCLKKEIKDEEIEAISFDLGQEDEIDIGFENLCRRGLLPDILINNAAHLGLGESGFLEQTPDFFRKVMNVNLFGAFRCSQLSAKEMVKKRWGRIINVSSLAGERILPGRSAYSVSKAALDGLNRCMAVELSTHGIGVNSIAPGYIWTPRWNQIEESTAKQRRLSIPVGEPTSQDEIAQLILFLCTKPIVTLTGARIVIDGGIGIQGQP